jgi:hypothetical protein
MATGTATKKKKSAFSCDVEKLSNGTYQLSMYHNGRIVESHETTEEQYDYWNKTGELLPRKY